MNTAATRFHERLAGRHRRAAGGGRLAACVLAAAIVNLLLLVALTESLFAARPAPEMPVAVVPLTRADPPPPPEAAELEEPPPPEQAPPTAPPLPPLELAAPSADPDALRIPVMLDELDLSQMPLRVPAFAAQRVAPGEALSFDRGPELLVRPDFEGFYPRSARRHGIEGTSRVRIEVAADGSVSAVELLDSDPPGVFEEAARALCRRLRYRPAQRGGSAVAGSVVHVLQWEIRR